LYSFLPAKCNQEYYRPCLSGFAAAAPAEFAEKDIVSNYNANIDVAYYKSCWNRWVSEIQSTGISTPDASE
jgi:hypothetical protein